MLPETKAPPSSMFAAARAMGILVAIAFAVFVAIAPPAGATPGGAVLLAQSLPAAGWQGAVDFTIACDTNGEILEPTTTVSGAATMALTCWVDGATDVYFGSASTMVTTANGIPVSESGTASNLTGPAIYRTPMAKRGVFGCIVASGTVTIRCNGATP